MKIRKFMIIVISVIMLVLTSNIMVNAYITDDYQNATTVSLSQTITTDKITSADDENWYKFTTTNLAGYSIQLSNAPSIGDYRFELRYQNSSNSRPVIIGDYGEATSTLFRMSGVLRTPGTYYIRVYSATGAYSTTAYKLQIRVYYNMTYTFSNNLTQLNSVTSSYDWLIAAERVAKYAYKNEQSTNLPSRTYANASRFIYSNGSTDIGNAIYVSSNKTIDNTVIAANYIYSGDYMQKPRFAVENKTYSVADFLEKIWRHTSTEYPNPPIIQLKEPGTSEKYSDYYVIANVDLYTSDSGVYGINCSGEEVYFDYVDLTVNGDADDKIYTGKNIIRVD